MRKLIYIWIGLVLFSCGGKDQSSQSTASSNATSKVITEEVDPENDVYSGTVELPVVLSGDTSLVTLDYEYYINPDSAYKKAVNDEIMVQVKRVCSFEMSGRVGKQLDSLFFLEELEVFVKAAQDASREYDELVPWELELAVWIDSTKFNSVELHVSHWSYTGGAHGNGELNIVHFNRTTGKKMGISDYFKDEKGALTIAEQFFREATGMNENESFETAGYEFFNGFEWSANFSFGEKEMYLSYNPYEIGPYSMGPTDVKIPLESLKPFMK